VALAQREQAEHEPLTDTYVQEVPDKCDRIVWRGYYFHLPVSSTSKPEQPPVAWACFKNGELQTELVGTEADVDFWCASDEPEMQGMVKGALYTHPPRREWRGLTEEEIRDLWSWSATSEAERTATTQQHAFARAIEAKLKERNA
jgi:hypothetical protein